MLDVVMMGHTEMWAAISERDAIYANPEATEDDHMRAADLEAKFAEYDGYTAEARAGELLLGLEIAVDQHNLLMREIAPGWSCASSWRRRCSPTRRAAAGRAHQQPGHQYDPLVGERLNGYQSTMIIISHDRHFLNQVCTHMADVDYGEIRVYPGNYDDYMLASTQARERLTANNAKAKEHRRTAGLRAPVRGQQVQVAPGHVAPEADRPHQGRSGRGQALVAPEPVHPLRAEQGHVPPGGHDRKLSKSYDQPVIRDFRPWSTPARKSPSSAPTG